MTRHNTLLYKSWRIMSITIKATLIEVLLYKPERNSVAIVDIRGMRMLGFHNVRPRSRAAKPTPIVPAPPRRTAPAPFFPVAAVPVEFDVLCFARASKASKVFALDSFAFTEKTIPPPQWPVWRQYAQIGEVSFTWTVYVGKVVAFALTAMLINLYDVSDT